jgi:hypothetical protein
MQITEPVTMLTDYALGAANLFFAVSIYSNFNSKNRVTGLLLLLGFAAHALSAFAGGTFHGFALQLQTSGRQQVWTLIAVSIGAAIGFLASAIHAADVHRESGRWIVMGISLGVMGLAIQMSGFGLHRDFNHNDIFHVIQIVAMYFFFKGARDLRDRAYSPR